MKPLISNPQKKTEGWPPPRWRSLMFNVILALVMLWAWQEGAYQVAVRAIPYSEFKEYVKRGEVVECSVKETEIVGKIQPQATASKETELSAPAATAPTSKSTSADKVPTEAKPQAEGKETKSPPAAPNAFMFRTVRVEDPDLVRDLETARVKFTGMRPGLMSQVLWAWVVPIALMWLLWQFLSRRMKGVGQSVLSFGSSGAKLVADQDTKVTFNDVAGCDEAKYELQEVVTFLKQRSRRASCWLVRLAQGRRCWRVLSPGKRKCPSFRSVGVSLWKCSLALAQPGSATCSSRQKRMRRASCSSTNWMPWDGSAACRSGQ